MNNLNMRNSMAMLIFFVLDWKYSFLGQIWSKFGPKNQNSYFELKFGTMTNLNMRNSMAMLTFSVLDTKCPLLVNLIQKTKIVSLS